MDFDFVDSGPQSAVIKVFGVGGGGGNAIQHMLEQDIDGVDFIAANTDAQALKKIRGAHVLQLGSSITRGLGAGANPDIGCQAALEDRDRIAELLTGADMAFVTAGMGGGTGTGGAPVVARTAKEMGILTVAVVTRPFRFERRDEVADRGIDELAECVDSLITIPNERLLAVLGEKTSMLEAFGAANNVLLGAVQGIADLITRPGLINVDFADVRTVMAEMGMAMMGTGIATGDDRAAQAADAAIRSPLLEDVDLQGACGILVNVSAGPNLSIGEFEEVGKIVEGLAAERARVVAGTVIDPEMGDELRVTIVATGLGLDRPKETTNVVDYAKSQPPRSARPSHHDIQRPAVERQPARSGTDDLAQEPQFDERLLDIPAFLRKQAD